VTVTYRFDYPRLLLLVSASRQMHNSEYFGDISNESGYKAGFCKTRIIRGWSVGISALD
jgi:hypothetical protein